MASISIEQARLQVALAHPELDSSAVRREADRIVSVLDSIEAADNMRAAWAAQQAEEQAQKAVEAERRAEALNDARAIVRRSHPGWDDASVNMQAEQEVAANESAIAAMNLRNSLEGGFDK